MHLKILTRCSPTQLNFFSITLYIFTLCLKQEAENMAENPSFGLHSGRSTAVQGSSPRNALHSSPGRLSAEPGRRQSPCPAHSPWGSAGTLLCRTALGTRLQPRLHSLQPTWDTEPSGLCSDTAAWKHSIEGGIPPQ